MRKLLKRQLSFNSLLEPDVPLDPRVVLITDPRWAASLVEMSTTPYAGIDTEGFDDSAAAGGRPSDEPQRGDFDPFASTIRLIQVALPSGVCAVADLGGIGDDRAARYRLYGDEGIVDREAYIASNKPLPYIPGSFFAVLRDLVEDPKRSKILHHAKFDALWLRIHFGWRMRGIRCTMLLSQLYWAGLQVRHGLGFLSERAVAAGAPGVWRVSKELQKSEWRWHLSNAQINYAATDALVMLPLFKWLGGLITAAGMLPTALAECNAVAAFVEFEYNGLPVNPAMLADHIELWRRGRELAIQPFRQRYPGVDPAKTQMVAVALSLDNCYDSYRFYDLDIAKPRRQPLYILGQRFDHGFKKKDDRYAEAEDHSVAEAVLTRWSHLPWISALLDWRSMSVVLKWMESIAARLRSDARVRGEYAQLAGGVNRGGDDASGRGHGRSSCIARGTLIQTACDRSKYPNGVPIEEVQAGDWVFCFDQSNKLRLRRVTAAWSNGVKPVIRLVWRGTGRRHTGHLDLTADHLVRLVDGNYKPASNLQPGDRVAALHPAQTGGYGRLFVTGYKTDLREHRFVYEEVTGSLVEHVHHVNHNKLDNRPLNLQGLSQHEHLTLHAAEISPELRAKRSRNGKIIAERERPRLLAQLKKVWVRNTLQFTREDLEKALEQNGWSITRTKNALGHDHITFLKHLRAAGLDPDEIKRKSAALDTEHHRGKGYNRKYCKKCGADGHFAKSCGKRRKGDGKRLCSLCGQSGHYRGTCGNDNRRIYRKRVPNNHEILEVIQLSEPIEVFDLAVEEFPNFIAGELCVHNCSRPSLQQSANPQPKLNKLIHQAMGWTGEVAAMSPRIPFTGHDAFAAGYLRWAVARLRGELPDPFTARDEAIAQQVQYQQPEGWTDEDAAEDTEDNNEPTAVQPLPNLTVAERIAWYERLASQWEAQPRRFIVADFSQAHMRIAAQVSQDPQLCEDFRLDRDAHLKLAYDFGVATKQIPADLPIEAFFAWYDKRHPKHKFVKSLRQPAKTGNYTSLNLGSVARLKGAGDTAKPPVILTYDEWGIIRDAWRKRYAGLFGYQKAHIANCNAHDVVIEGTHYGMARSLVTGGRLWLRKESDKYSKAEPRLCADCGKTHGRLTVKGTDAVAFVWLRTEADAIKWALARILEEFDQHDSYFMERGLVARGDVWGARMGSMAHDEADVDADARYALAAAGCVRRWFAAGLRWAGVVDVPVEPADSRDSDLIVKSWADK